MVEVSVIIPNYNGLVFMDQVLESLEKQTYDRFEVIMVDNGSTDGSSDFVRKTYPWVKIIQMEENFGFCKAVNEGIKASKARYVLLLNNDTEAEKDFVYEMTAAIRRHPKAFAVGAKMIQFHDRKKIDDAGDLYCALGWSFARGKGRSTELYEKEEKVFSCCGGAVIYRRRLFDRIGLFDEEHYAYLEDTDIGYRARIYGYENWFAPKARVYHVGSGTTGSRYNTFKTRFSSRNNIYLLYKNMPTLQILLNLPFLLAGFGTKLLFFTLKGMGYEYAAGIYNGIQISLKGKKVPFRRQNMIHYIGIQLDLWRNMFRRFGGKKNS